MLLTAVQLSAHSADERFQALMDSDADPDGLIDRYSGTDQIDKLRYVTGWNSKLLSALRRSCLD